ncbi:MAG TPA: transcriptional regulator, partial [Armatimonadetes bacterium]|nr:transcriptional regulator [Armatimonadota bacterium]
GPTLLDDAARRAAIGYAGPDTWPYRALTVAENLEFFAHLRGVPVDPELVALVGLEDRLGQLVSELSTGYVQRLRLALATVHRPSVLLLDEPGANLDATGHAVVAAVIAAQRERGPCLLAANDPRDIAHGNRIIELGG